MSSAQHRTLTDVYVVSHTHWDREWYRTREQFLPALVQFIDELIDNPPVAPQSFLLDGQAILLDDYLSVRPERAAELSRLLADRSIEAGPWYVLADELIPSGEALVRNLLHGRATLRRLRAVPPGVLYCPDSFGHPAVLPDLAAGFGCESIVLWRGLSSPSDLAKWTGSAGNSAIVIHLPPDGYEFGSALPSSAEPARERWKKISATLEPRSNSGSALLLNGADHHARQPDLAAALEALADSANARVHVTSLGEAARAITAAAVDETLPSLTDELRNSYGYTWTLQGTLGTRAYQKRANAIVERTLLRDVEPWLALAGQGGASADRALLDYAWKSVLENHPHDTLCGTSIDAVAHAFDARNEASRALIDELRARAIADLTATSPRTDTAERVVVIRNPCARRRSGVAALSVKGTLADVAVGPGSHTRQGMRGELPPFSLAHMHTQSLHERECIALTLSPHAYPNADLVREVTALAWVDGIAGYSTLTAAQERDDTGQVAVASTAVAIASAYERYAPPEVPFPVTVSEDGATASNGLIAVTVCNNGVSVMDVASGRSIENLIQFERHRDVGDLYTPAIREYLEAPQLVASRAVARGPLRAAFELVYAPGDVRVRVSLDASSRSVQVGVRGNNHSNDQRLRVLFSSALPEARTIADAAFHPLERAELSVAPNDREMEHVVPTAPLHRWVARFSADAGMALISDGLAEYESNADGRIAVTLVRSVGELSRLGIQERPGTRRLASSNADGAVHQPFRGELCRDDDQGGLSRNSPHHRRRS